MKMLGCVLLLVMLFASPLAADDLWRELLPDRGAAMLSVSQNLDGQILLAGSWDAFQLGGRAVEGDLWSVSPLSGGLSWGGFGNVECPRYLGIGYDGNLSGDKWYNRLVIYGKTSVELNF